MVFGAEFVSVPGVTAVGLRDCGIGLVSSEPLTLAVVPGADADDGTLLPESPPVWVGLGGLRVAPGAVAPEWLLVISTVPAETCEGADGPGTFDAD